VPLAGSMSTIQNAIQSWLSGEVHYSSLSQGLYRSTGWNFLHAPPHSTHTHKPLNLVGRAHAHPRGGEGEGGEGSGSTHPRPPPTAPQPPHRTPRCPRAATRHLTRKAGPLRAALFTDAGLAGLLCSGNAAVSPTGCRGNTRTASFDPESGAFARGLFCRCQTSWSAV
jgi:hypothetical protein